MQPIRRARVWCKWHGGHFLPIAEYREAVAAQRVQEALLERSKPQMTTGIDWGSDFVTRLRKSGL